MCELRPKPKASASLGFWRPEAWAWIFSGLHQAWAEPSQACKLLETPQQRKDNALQRLHGINTNLPLALLLHEPQHLTSSGIHLVMETSHFGDSMWAPTDQISLHHMAYIRSKATPPRNSQPSSHHIGWLHHTQIHFFLNLSTYVECFTQISLDHAPFPVVRIWGSSLQLSSPRPVSALLVVPH